MNPRIDDAIAARRSSGKIGALLVSICGLTTCGKAPEYAQLSRDDFNRRAAEEFLPLFWREDANRDGKLQADELAVLWGYGEDKRSDWVETQTGFTPKFIEAYRAMAQPDPRPNDAAEQKRRDAVLLELSQGRPTLVQTDLTVRPPTDTNLVRHLMNAAESIERIYRRQNGVFGLDEKIPTADTASRMLFHRNQSPYCEAPRTEGDANCSALARQPKRVVGLYPSSIQGDPKFCEMLGRAPNAKALMDHFSVVVEDAKPGAFKAVPYHEAYKEDMEAVAKELAAAANGLGDDEAALRTYLLDAAKGFLTNDWEPANRSWVAMSAENSRWYVRIAPDEVYFEPCAWKAGFALQLARINPESLEWRNKLDPLKNDMERTLATMAGAPYTARAVNFKLPDFIDVVLNAGDQRPAHGATIGQSLPNWGAVAEAGGRTVAMTNLYTDADSQQQLGQLMSSLFCKATDAHSTTGGRESLIGSLLHEAAHNLGPSHEYKAFGKVDDEAFGGTLASTLEELKAQTSSMFLTDWLADRGLFTRDEAARIQLRNIAWAFGHISRGMYAADGTPRNYSQLAAIQVGSLLQAGAVAWKSAESAANGQDRGCMEIDFEQLPRAVRGLEATVLKIKARGDKTGAEQLKAQFVDGQDDFAKLKAVVAERWLRAPKATFVYSVVF